MMLTISLSCYFSNAIHNGAQKVYIQIIQNQQYLPLTVVHHVVHSFVCTLTTTALHEVTHYRAVIGAHI